MSDKGIMLLVLLGVMLTPVFISIGAFLSGERLCDCSCHDGPSAQNRDCSCGDRW